MSRGLRAGESRRFRELEVKLRQSERVEIEKERWNQTGGGRRCMSVESIGR